MVRIEPMTELDLAAVLAIDLEAFHPNPLDREEPHILRERQLREELARPFGRLRVARGSGSRATPANENRIVGYVLFWHVTDEIHLLNVAVEPSERRNGVGRALVNDVIAYTKANAAAKILLEVRAGNTAAIRLYEALGFSTFNVRERYYPDGEDGVEMVLSSA